MNSWDILKHAKNGSVNVGSPFAPFRENRQKNLTLAIGLEKDGLLTRQGNGKIFHLTGKGKVALKYDTEEEYYQAINSDSNLEAIVEGLDAVKNIYEGNLRTQLIVKYVSIGTGVFIAIQATFTVVQYFYPRQKNTQLEQLEKVEKATEYQEHQLYQMKTTLDSLKLDIRRKSTTANSSLGDSIK
jgi:hypothetical protein